MTEAKLRILVVDDANLVRMYYRDALESAGFEVETAINGVEAFEKLLVQACDLLVVDINMPQMDGLTFLTTLRKQDDPLASTPALMISTEAAPHDRDAASVAGANFYLVKPVEPAFLTACAAMLCGLQS